MFIKNPEETMVFLRIFKLIMNFIDEQRSITYNDNVVYVYLSISNRICADSCQRSI